MQSECAAELDKMKRETPMERIAGGGGGITINSYPKVLEVTERKCTPSREFLRTKYRFS